MGKHRDLARRLMFMGAVASAYFWILPECEAQSRIPNTGRLVSLTLMPKNPTIWGARATQRLLVMGKFADGMERDVTAQCRFSVANPQVARVDNMGKVLGLADGKTAVSAWMAERSARTELTVADSDTSRPFSFARDIGAIFTKHGCNTSSCHGGVKGQGGFKLSLNALYPEDDHKWIVQGGTYNVLTTETGAKNPRVNLQEPEKSLLLLKATMGMAHGGGQRFRADSPDYQTILSWVRTGAPYGEKGVRSAVETVRVEVFPRDSVLDAHGKQQLLVSAYLSNGRQQDISDAVLYVSNNPEVVKVTPDGVIQAVRTGETSVMIRAAGYAINAGVGVIAKPIPNYPQVERSNFIDDHIFEKLKKFNILASELSDDAEFLRRLCLDLTGTLPPPHRIREFTASNDPQKRQKLIDALMNSPEYLDYWTFRFADLFRVSRHANKIHGGYAQMYWEWIRDAIENDKPYDEMARERIAVQGYTGPAAHYLPYEEIRQPQDKMAEQVRVFLGRRLDCAQCHNHPFEAWSQNQFWGMTAFFGRMNGITAYPNDKGSIIYDDPDGQEIEFGDVGKSRKVVNPRTKEIVQPALLDGKVLTEQDAVDLRMKLARWMTSHPYFAEAAVNRIWSYFFGRGIVDPVDDFRSTNPPTHPDLLQALASDFRQHGHDLKYLIRLIVSSRTYQLSSRTNETNRDDAVNYSHRLPRQLDAEVLLDAISHVTEVPELFEINTNQDSAGMAPPGTRALNLREPDAYPSRFCEVYGRPLRHTVPERKGDPNLLQALHRLAGSTYTAKLEKEGGRIDRLLQGGKSDHEIIEELYLLTLSRYPTKVEETEVTAAISRRSVRREALQDLLWALLASPEFSDNH